MLGNAFSYASLLSSHHGRCGVVNLGIGIGLAELSLGLVKLGY